MANGRGRGRPTRIDEPFDVLRDGTPRTIADAICDHLRVGMHIEGASGLCGVHHDTVLKWLRDGAHARQRRSRGEPRRDLTSYQRRAHDFNIAAHEALAECERRDLGRLNALAAGAIPLTTVEEELDVWTDADGQEQTRVVRRKVKTVETLPDLRAITWRLTRRFPDRWSPRIEVGIGVGELPSRGEDADRTPAKLALAELERKIERQREVRNALGDGVIDVKLVDERPPQED